MYTYLYLFSSELHWAKLSYNESWLLLLLHYSGGIIRWTSPGGLPLFPDTLSVSTLSNGSFVGQGREGGLCAAKNNHGTNRLTTLQRRQQTWETVERSREVKVFIQFRRGGDHIGLSCVTKHLWTAEELESSILSVCGFRVLHFNRWRCGILRKQRPRLDITRAGLV